MVPAIISNPALRGRARVFLTATLISLCVAVTVASLPAPAAAAEDKTAARDHWERGTKFYDLGKYDDAIREFEAAYEAKGDPAFLYNLAQSHRLAGHPTESLRFYRTYLRYVPKAPNRPDIEDRIKELEKTIADHPGEAATAPPPRTSGAAPAGAAAAAAAGGPTSPPPSTASSPPSGNGATVPPAPQEAATGTVGAAGAGAGVTSLQPESSPGTQGTAIPPVDSAPGSPPTSGRSVRKVAGIALAAGGGGLIVVGGIFGLVARSQSKKVETAAANAERFDPSVESLGKTAQTLQWIGYGIGAAALVTGLVLYVTAPASGETPAPRVAVAPVAVPGSGGAFSMRVTF